MTAREVKGTLQNDEYRVLARFLRSYIVKRGFDYTIARYQKLCMPKTAYVSCCRTPTSTDKKQNGLVKLEDNGWRTIQRSVAEKSFYGFSKERYDTVLVSRERNGEENLCQKSSKEISLWFGKALAFL